MQLVNLLIVFFFFFCPLLVFPDTIQKPYFRYSERIVAGNSGYQTEIIIGGKSPVSGTEVYIPVPPLSVIKQYEAFKLRNNKLKKLGAVRFSLQEMPQGSEFNNGSWSLATFELPENNNFELRCKIECKELMLLNFLSFRTLFADTVNYELIVPKRMNLFYRLKYISYLKEIKIDSTDNDTARIYQFHVISSYMNMDYIRKAIVSYCSLREPIPGIQLIIVPAEYKANPSRYLNDWYVKQLQSFTKPDSNMIHLVDSITGDSHLQDTIINRLFLFSRDKIRYINFYEALETIIPKNVNDILQLRIGDCKDKANFLCQALKLNGIDAHLAICSTRDHGVDMDFPSLSGGNHMICVVGTADPEQWMILDPTNPIGTVKRPGYRLEGRSMFIIDHVNKSPVTIKSPLSHDNNVYLRFDLCQKEDKLQGEAIFVFEGYSGDYLRNQLSRISKKNHQKVITDYLKSLASINCYELISLRVTDDSVSVKALITVPASVITMIENKYYLQMNFIPFVHMEFPVNGHYDLLVDHILFDRADINIRFSDPVASIKLKNTEIPGDPFFQINSKFSDREVNIHYAFRVTGIDIPGENQKKWYEHIQGVSKIFNDVIVVETKK